MEYEWPGNIRELEHTLEHAFILCRHNIITPEHLPPEVKKTIPKSETSEEDEVKEIIAALEKTGWNKAKAARLLGIDRKTIYRKIEKYKIGMS